jgi:penicillin-binding protein 2
MSKIFRKKHGRISTSGNIDPDEIFLDSQNLPGFDTNQFEGRIEKPISKKTIIGLGLFFTLITFIFLGRVWNLQITNGQEYLDRSVKNSLRHTLIFADRGIIYDTNNNPLAWNNSREQGQEFSTREYKTDLGLATLFGYVTYPKKDSAGFYFDEEISGVDGLESIYDDYLAGENGLKIIETNAVNEVVSQSTTDQPENGEDLYLTIDEEVQKAFHDSIKKIVDENGFEGGGGVIMNVENGDLAALVSYPEYNSNVLNDGEDDELIASYINDNRNPFLNRITEGLYTPGSIIKPFIAIAALQENIITPNKEILSTKQMIIPNPFNPELPSIFTDWKAHGLVDVRRALAMSSNIYFYQVGGGYDALSPNESGYNQQTHFNNQEGLGISRIEEYLHKFGFGEKVNLEGFNNQDGTIPNPEWKRETFDDDWRLGDTYFTSIGQYGFQVTPIQVARAVSAIANDGKVIEPRIVKNFKNPAENIREVDIDQKYFDVVKQGMRDAVEYGTAKGLLYEDLDIAAKTGTAELGVSKEKVNSWSTGFFPYDNPKYAFVIFLEKGDRKNLIGGVAAARGFFDWARYNKPEFLR